MLEAIFVQPLLNILFIIEAAIPGHDFGVTIIVLTILIRLALYPLAKKQLHSQRALTKIQPEINKLRERYKKDSQKLQAAMLELYKEKEVNPFGSCLPLLIQMPFLIGLFYVFIKFREDSFLVLNEEGILGQIYPFVERISFVEAYIVESEKMSTFALGIVDLAHPFAVLAVVAGALQFVQSKMLLPKKKTDDPSAKLMRQMTYILPILTVVVSLQLPAALSLYWSAATLFAIGQQYFVMRHDVEELEKESERKPAKKRKKNRK